MPGAGDREAVGPVVEGARDEKVSLVCQLVEAGGDGLAERDVEAFSREIACLRIVDGEAHSLALLACQGGACRCDALGFGIEGVDRGRTCGGEGCEPTFAAADIEHAFAVEVDETDDRSRLGSGCVALLHLVLRLVGLDGGAARSVLLCLAAGVFEGGSGVGVDELAGLDPLEAVTL